MFGLLRDTFSSQCKICQYRLGNKSVPSTCTYVVTDSWQASQQQSLNDIRQSEREISSKVKAKKN